MQRGKESDWLDLRTSFLSYRSSRRKVVVKFLPELKLIYLITKILRKCLWLGGFRFISTFTGLTNESKRKGLSAKYFCVVWKIHLGRNRMTHERNLLWNQWVIKTKNKCCHDSILFCNSKSQYLHIRFSDPALLLVFWYSPLVDSSEVAFCLPKHISYNEACSRFAIVSLGNTGPFLTSKVSKDIITTDLSIFRNTKNQMFISLAGFYLNRARFHVRFPHTWFVVRIMELQSIFR